MTGILLTASSAMAETAFGLGKEQRALAEQQQEVARQQHGLAKQRPLASFQDLAAEQESLAMKQEDLARRQEALAEKQQELAAPSSSSLSDFQLWSIVLVLALVMMGWRLVSASEANQGAKQETLRAMVNALAKDRIAPIDLQAARQCLERLLALLNSSPPRLRDMLTVAAELHTQLTLLEERSAPLGHRLKTVQGLSKRLDNP